MMVKRIQPFVLNHLIRSIGERLLFFFKETMGYFEKMKEAKNMFGNPLKNDKNPNPGSKLIFDTAN